MLHYCIQVSYILRSEHLFTTVNWLILLHYVCITCFVYGDYLDKGNYNYNWFEHCFSSLLVHWSITDP